MKPKEHWYKKQELKEVFVEVIMYRYWASEPQCFLKSISALVSNLLWMAVNLLKVSVLFAPSLIAVWGLGSVPEQSGRRAGWWLTVIETITGTKSKQIPSFEFHTPHLISLPAREMTAAPGRHSEAFFFYFSYGHRFYRGFWCFFQTLQLQSTLYLHYFAVKM